MNELLSTSIGSILTDKNCEIHQHLDQENVYAKLSHKCQIQQWFSLYEFLTFQNAINTLQ